MSRLARRVARKADLQGWLRAQVMSDPPPRRVKKSPAYKSTALVEKLEHGKVGSAEFWDMFPVNPKIRGGGLTRLMNSC